MLAALDESCSALITRLRATVSSPNADPVGEINKIVFIPAVNGFGNGLSGFFKARNPLNPLSKIRFQLVGLQMRWFRQQDHSM